MSASYNRNNLCTKQVNALDMRTSSSASKLPFEAEDVLLVLADRVRTVRKIRGLTQQDLAAKAGISTNTVVTMEKGAGSVQLGYWLQVLWALDLLGGVADLLGRLGREPGDAAVLEAQLPKRVRGGASR
jgi:DNA-binding XRE family transcriptional regulator